jgi:hypothetical protein
MNGCYRLSTNPPHPPKQLRPKQMHRWLMRVAPIVGKAKNASKMLFSASDWG